MIYLYLYLIGAVIVFCGSAFVFGKNNSVSIGYKEDWFYILMLSIAWPILIPYLIFSGIYKLFYKFGSKFSNK